MVVVERVKVVLVSFAYLSLAQLIFVLNLIKKGVVFLKGFNVVLS